MKDCHSDVSPVNYSDSEAVGPDKIPTRLLELGAKDLAPGLTTLYQLSLDQGKLPTDWKTANVSPAFKKGNRSSPANYIQEDIAMGLQKWVNHLIYL